MEDRRFRELFKACIEIVLNVWYMMEEDGLLPDKSNPKHLLWTLHFLRYIHKRPPDAPLLVVGGVLSTQKHCKNGFGSS
jgi:hypothetical protein